MLLFFSMLNPPYIHIQTFKTAMEAYPIFYLIIIDILIPSLAGFLHQNACSKQISINLLLTTFNLYSIGIIYAVWPITD